MEQPTKSCISGLGKIIHYSQCKSISDNMVQKGPKRFNTSGNQTQISRSMRLSQALNQTQSSGARILNPHITFIISNITFSDITTNSILINYEGYFNGVSILRDGVQIYNVCGSVSKNDTSYTPFSYLDTNLDTNTLYNYTIIPYKTVNIKGISNSNGISTLPLLTDFTISNITDNSVSLNWNGLYTNVILYRDGTQIYKGTNTSFNDMDVSSNVFYEYMISPLNINNVSGNSYSTAILTLPSIISLSFSNITISSISLLYSGYYSNVVIKRNGEPIYSGSNTSFNDIGLNINSQYTYEVIPFNVDNISGVSVYGTAVTIPEFLYPLAL